MGDPNNPNYVVVQQPVNSLSSCPPGLQYLLSIDQVLVKQNPEIFEALTGLETSNKYDILNTMGQPVFKAIELNNCCFLNCCGSYRCFTMKILNNTGMEVMHIERPLRCNGSCFPFCCCGQEMKVYCPPGHLIGRIVQNISFCGARFEIRDENDQAQLRVQGPCCVFDYCGNVDFQVLPMENDTQIGVVTKQWAGLAKEAFTDADNFGVCFPLDLEVRMKALLVAQIILIDYMFFENNTKK